MGADTGLADMTFGSMAGMVAKVFEHPFDLVKVRLQSQPTDRPLSFKGPFDCFKQTYMKEGLRGLYRGISAPIAGAACENATLFLVYGKCQDLIYYLRPRQVKQLGLGELALAGAGAGAVTSFVLTPIELIKCRMQVQMLAREGAFGPSVEAAAAAATSSTTTTATTTPLGAATTAASSSRRAFSTTSLSRQIHAPPPQTAPEGPITLILNTIRTSGLRGLWLGQTGTLIRETGGGVAWFGAYELSTRLWLKHFHPPNSNPTKADLSSLQLMASGALAGVSYNVILFPADSVKSSMQTWAELNPTSPRIGFGQTAKNIWRTRGLKGLYAGCGLTCLRSGPSSAMIFLIYQRLEQNFGYLFGIE